MDKFIKFAAIFCLMFFSCVFLNGAAAAQSAINDNSGKLRALAGNGIDGAWQLNIAESDDPLEKMQELIQNIAGASNSAENSNVKQLPPLSTSLFHPGTLTLAGSGKDQITINEGFQEVVQTRSILADGKTHSFELSPGANYTVTARRDDRILTVETISPRGNKMIETYEVESGGQKLKATIRIENTQARELITLHRTYNRTIIDIFSGDNGVVQ